MNLTRKILLLTFSALIFASSPAGGETAGATRVSGSNTAKFEYYNAFGDKAASPYAHRYGQFYDEVDLDLSRRLSAFENWRLQTSGLYNDSEYRSAEKDLVLERFKFSWEKGDGDLPFRMDGGDIYGYFSYRTLQKSLKGAKMEFQPDWFGVDNSLVLLTGAQGSSWGHMDVHQDTTRGFSWLASSGALGNVSANWVHNRREADAAAGQLARDQQVFSLTGEKRFGYLGQNLRLEGEAAYFSGDHADTGAAGSGQDHADTGLFVQAGGQGDGPLSYRARYELYGQNFRPAGAGVTADREAGEIHLGWRFPVGLRLNGRVQHFTDGQESANPVETDTLGVNLSGSSSAWVQGLAGNLDLYRQEADSRDRTTDRRTDNANLNLGLPLGAGFNGRLGLVYRNTDDRVAGGTGDNTTREARVSVSHGFAVGGWKGFFEPGLAVRHTETTTDDDRSLVPTLTTTAARGPHRLHYNFTMNRYHRQGAGTEDLSTVSHGLRYGYAQKIDHLTVEVRNDYRNPEKNESTDSFYAGITWVRNFDGLDSLLAVPFAQGIRKARTSADSAAAAQPAQLFFGIAPGMTRAAAQARLGRAGAGQPLVSAGYEVHEIRLLKTFDQRQRLAVAHTGDSLKEAALLMDLDALGGPDSIGQIHGRVKKELVERFGSPDLDVEKGDFGPNLAAAISSDTFVRLAEWHSRQGILRFGIPRRLDGAVRIEIRFAEEFPPPAVTAWSIEVIR